MGIVMDVDHFHTARDDTLIKRRPWYILAGGLFVLSALAHQPLAFLVALFALVIGIVPEIWYRRALRHLVLRQQLSERRVFFGETTTLSISIENRKFLPLPWLEIEDEIPVHVPLLTGRAAPSYKVNRALLVNSVSLWAFQRVTRRYHLRCLARGVYTFGPVQMRSGDPFGWLIREEQVQARETLLVYPLVAPIEAFGLSPRTPFGEGLAKGRLLEDPFRIAGVREYAFGDDPRRIHWKATARVGELRSKIYEPAGQHRVLILLDINTYKEVWMGHDPELQELTITAAASLALWALDKGYAVGLLVNSLMMSLSGEGPSSDGETPSQVFIHRVYVPITSNSRQRERLLSALGRLLPYSGSSMDALIDAEHVPIATGTTILLISAAAIVSATTIERLLYLRKRGAAVHLALTGDDASVVGTDTYDLPVHHLGGREKWHELTRSINNAGHEFIGQSETSLHLD
jgi:uncharacterized protein (DUF58 family)